MSSSSPSFSHQQHFGRGLEGFTLRMQVVENTRGTKKRVFLRFELDHKDLTPEPLPWAKFTDNLLQSIPDLAPIEEPAIWPGNIQEYVFEYTGKHTTPEISHHIFKAISDSQRVAGLETTPYLKIDTNPDIVVAELPDGVSRNAEELPASASPSANPVASPSAEAPTRMDIEIKSPSSWEDRLSPAPPGSKPRGPGS